MASPLELILVLLASAVLAVTAFRSMHLPPLLGYLIVGVAIGPFALALIPDSGEMRRLADFGIVFLMFSIGLEFSLPTLFSMRRAVASMSGDTQKAATAGEIFRRRFTSMQRHMPRDEPDCSGPTVGLGCGEPDGTEVSPSSVCLRVENFRGIPPGVTGSGRELRLWASCIK